MSKNTGTSKLINYFTLGENGDVAIAGSLDINTILQADSDTDKFLVSNTGIIKYRTGAQLLSDIGGQGALTNPVTGTGTTNYLPKFTGASTIGNSQVFDNGTNVLIGTTTNATGLPTFYIQNKNGLVANIAGFNFATTSTGDNSNNNILSSGSYYSGSAVIATQTNASIYQQYAGEHLFYTNSGLTVGNSYSATERMRITSGGNLLVGTTSDAGFRMAINGPDGTSYVKFTSTAAATGGRIGYNGNEMRIDQQENANLIFRTNGSTQMTITSSGNVGIGTTSLQATYKVTISGTDTIFPAIYLENTTNSQAYSIRATGTNFVVRDNTSGNDRFTIASTGAATFSSSVTSQVNNISADGAGVVLQGYVDNNLRIAVRGSGYNDGGRGSLIAQSGDFAGTLSVTGAATFSSNVGVGDSNPLQKLVVKGGSLLVNSGTSATAFRDIMIGGIDGWYPGESHGIDTVYNTTSSPITFSRIESHFDGTSGRIRFRNLFFSSAPRTDILMTIEGNGNVLIGTTTDNGARLQVSGAATFSSSVTTGDNVVVGNPNSSVFFGTSAIGYGTSPAVGRSSTNGFHIQNSIAGDLCIGAEYSKSIIFGTGTSLTLVQRMAITSGGNVGIGTASPGNFNSLTFASPILDVVGSLNIRGIAANGASVINMGGETYRKAAIFTSIQDQDPFLGFSVVSGGGTSSSTTERMRITSSGNVLIGTSTDAGFKLFVNGAAIMGKSGNQALILRNGTTADRFIFYVGDGTSGTVADENYIINNNTDLNVLNNGGGVQLVNGATSWTSASDIKLKNINSIIVNAVEKIKTLKAINYSWKSDTKNKENLGLIAQEIKEVFPQIVDERKDGYLGVRYTELIPVLVSAIQELKQEIDTLKN